jgi:hypothetical protein
LTIFLNFAGVLFYSLVYSSLLDNIQQQKERNENCAVKLSELEKMLKKTQIFKGRKRHLYRQMVDMIKHHKEDNNTQEFKPNFNDVKPQDVNEIFFQILENVHKFNKNVFFQGLQPKMLWKDFYDNMTKRIYNKGEVIYERG